MEKNTSNFIIKLEEIIYKFPSILCKIDDPLVIEFINTYLPYSTGFEIECNQLHEYNKNFNAHFLTIPNILHVDCSGNEQRFRIPNGIKGLICLHDICNTLVQVSSLNMGSGIHYHIDMTDVFDNHINKEFIKKHNDYIINELIKWDTAKDTKSSSAQCFYDARGWVNFQPDFKTCEIRIGEMSFDYEVIVKRIIDANRIVRYLKNIINSVNPKLDELKKQLKLLDVDENVLLKISEMNKIINKRTQKI